MSLSEKAAPLFNVLVALWDIGNFWLGLAIKFLILAPVLLMLLAIFGFQDLVGWFALLIVFAGVIAIWEKPLVIPLINEARIGDRDPGPTILRALGTVFVADLVFALYLALVPVANKPKLVPVVILSSMVLILTASVTKAGMGCLRTILIGCIVVSTGAFFFSSTDFSTFVDKMNQRSLQTPSSSPGANQNAPLPTVVNLEPGQAAKFVELQGEAKIDFVHEGEILVRFQETGPAYILLPTNHPAMIPGTTETTDTLDINRQPVRSPGIGYWFYQGKQRVGVWMQPNGNQTVQVKIVSTPNSK